MLDKLETLSGKNAAMYNVKPGSQGIEGSPGSFNGNKSRLDKAHSRENSFGRDSINKDQGRHLRSQERSRASPSPIKDNYIEKLVNEIGIEERLDKEDEQ